MVISYKSYVFESKTNFRHLLTSRFGYTSQNTTWDLGCIDLRHPQLVIGCHRIGWMIWAFEWKTAVQQTFGHNKLQALE